MKYAGGGPQKVVSYSDVEQAMLDLIHDITINGDEGLPDCGAGSSAQLLTYSMLGKSCVFSRLYIYILLPELIYF